MLFNSLRHKLIYIWFFLGLVSSCKITDTPQMPRVAKLPATFGGGTDTTSLGDVSWDQLFSDRQLVSLIDTALKNNLDMQIALQRIDAARASYQIAKGANLPTVDARFRTRSGNIKENLLNNSINGEQNTFNQTQNYFLGFQSSWEIDVWGKLKNRKKAAYARFLATEKGKQLVTTSLIAEVAQLYYELLGLDNELETLEKNIELQDLALETIKIQKLGGRATELAVQQFSAQLLRTKSLHLEKKQRIIEVENKLNMLLGRYPQPIARGESILKQQLPAIIKAGVPADMLLRRPDVQQAELKLMAAKADVAAARAEFLPSFTITPYTGFQTESLPSLLQSPESLVLGFISGITVPIFNRYQVKSNYSRTVAQHTEAYLNYQKAILSGYQEVVSNLKRAENYNQVYELRTQETKILQQAIGTSNDLFAVGYASYLEVITAQTRVLEAELTMTNTRKEVFLSVVDLYRALGGGWQNQ